MLDFTPLRNQTASFADIARGLTTDDLHRLTNEIIDTELEIIAQATDKDIVFTPADPTFIPDNENTAPWSLAHVIAHATATSEGAASASVTLARGALPEGFAGSETPWENLKTVEQIRERLEESRRIRLAFLREWPEQPNLDVIWELRFGKFNALTVFIVGIFHEDSHLEQLRETIRQAHATSH